MSPVLPREERDAIRAVAIEAERGAKCGATYDGHTVDGVTVEMLADWTITLSRHAFALLGALDAAEAENERMREWKAEALPVMAGLQDLGRVLGVGLGQSITGEAGAAKARALMAERDAARAEVAALRGRIETLADWHETKAEKARRFPGAGNEAVMTKAAQVHDDAATRLRALAADEGERTGR